MISEQDKQRVLMASDIVEVIESFVPLKKAGQNYKGLCPFHNEKTPSFTVSPNKQIFHCFGCQESGGVISFMMKHEHLSYPEAVKALAERYNIEIEEADLTPELQAEKNKAESFAGILKMAKTWFQEQLHKTDKGRAIGLSYLKERGVSAEMIEKFGLGYCPPEGRSFSEHAISKGYSKAFLEELGLIKENERGVYDIYRGRLIFPITALGGKVIAFGARALKSGQQPKYINSPEHLVYNKSRTLYALNDSRKSIGQNDNVYVVEGYTDVIALHQSGVTNAVATCGTSVTEDHIARLRHMTKNVTLLFDGDAAGQKAALRTIKIVLKSGLNPRVIGLPEGEDPDSLTKKYSSFDLQNFLSDQAKDFLYYLNDTLFITAANDPIRKASASKVIMEAIAEIQDEVKRAFYIQECANLLSISEQAIAAEISKFRIKLNYQNKGERQLVERALVQSKEQEKIQKIDVKDSKGQEEALIKTLLLFGNEEYTYIGISEGEPITCKCLVAEFIIDELEHNGITFNSPLFQKVYNILRTEFQNKGKIDFQVLVQFEDQDIVKLISQILSREVIASANWEKKHGIFITSSRDKMDVELYSVLDKLKLKTVHKRLDEIKTQIKSIPSAEDLTSLQKEQIQLNQIKMKLAHRYGITTFEYT